MAEKNRIYISLGKGVELQGILCFETKLSLHWVFVAEEEKENKIKLMSNFEGLGIWDVQYFFYHLRREMYLQSLRRGNIEYNICHKRM